MTSSYSISAIVVSLIWKWLERSGTQGMQFVLQILLARFLLPEDFGLIAIVMVFISLANVLVQSGFATALVQRRDADNRDFSSILYLSLGVATVLYTVLFFVAPSLALFYEQPRLTPILRVLSLSLFFGAVNSVQNAYIARNMMFNTLFMGSLCATVVSGIAGVVAATKGLGPWALVIQQLANQAVLAAVLWAIVPWRPERVFSLHRVRHLLSFAWKLLLSDLIHTLYLDLRTLAIGRIYDSSILGYYNRGESIPKVVVSNLDGSIQAVMFSAFSAHQDDPRKLKSLVRRVISVSSFFVFPAMIGLAVVAEPLVQVLLTEKWFSAIPFVQLFCLSYIWLPVQTVNLQVISALGRSDITLRLQVIKKAISVIILVIAVPYGVFAIAIGAVISAIASMIVNMYPNRTLLGYSLSEQLSDVLPSLIISLMMGIAVHLVSLFHFTGWSLLLRQILLGVICYLGLAVISRNASLEHLAGLFRRIGHNQKEGTDTCIQR